jgi:urease gamma subunit
MSTVSVLGWLFSDSLADFGRLAAAVAARNRVRATIGRSGRGDRAVRITAIELKVETPRHVGIIAHTYGDGARQGKSNTRVMFENRSDVPSDEFINSIASILHKEQRVFIANVTTMHIRALDGGTVHMYDRIFFDSNQPFQGDDYFMPSPALLDSAGGLLLTNSTPPEAHRAADIIQQRARSARDNPHTKLGQNVFLRSMSTIVPYRNDRDIQSYPRP